MFTLSGSTSTTSNGFKSIRFIIFEVHLTYALGFLTSCYVNNAYISVFYV